MEMLIGSSGHRNLAIASSLELNKTLDSLKSLIPLVLWHGSVQEQQTSVYCKENWRQCNDKPEFISFLSMHFAKYYTCFQQFERPAHYRLCQVRLYTVMANHTENRHFSCMYAVTSVGSYAVTSVGSSMKIFGV